MNIGSYLRFGNMLTGAYDANQQDIVNQRQQQQLDNLLANSALARQIDWQKFQDYLAATQGEGAYFRGLANSLPSDQGIAPAPMPGQDSAQQPLPPVDTAQAFPVPPRNIQTVPLPGAESVPTFGPKQQFDHISTPEQVAAAVDAKKMNPNAAASVLLDMARRGVGQAPAPAASPAMPPAQQGQDADSPLSPGAYGRTLALIQNNQPLNLAARAAADLLKANPNMSNRELALTMGAVNPMLTKQADAVLRDARLSDTDFFKTISLLLRQEGLAARYPGLGDGQSPYTPQQLATAADMLRNGQAIPATMKPWVYGAYPDLAPEALQGNARKAAAVAAATAPIKAQQAVDTAKALEPIQVQREVDKTNATAASKANSAVLKQTESNLSATEAAYNALHTNFAGLVQAAKDLGLGPATPLNSVWNRLRGAVDPDYTTYDLFLKGVQKEFGKVLQGATGARGIAVSAMKDAEHTLSGNMTLGQLEAAQKALEAEGANVLSSLRQQKDVSTLRTKSMPAQDRSALEWADENPSDPRAKHILDHLKSQYGL